jgi:nonsense-mediated mRNA decay protein 3
VGTSIHLLDANTLQTADIPTPVYWRSPFKNLADVQELVEFIIMDIEPDSPAAVSTLQKPQ